MLVVMDRALDIVIHATMLALFILSVVGCEGRCDGAVEPEVVGVPYSIEPRVRYSCASDLVHLDFSSLRFDDTDGELLSIYGGPCVMQGEIRDDEHIDVECSLPGTCEEIYSLVGRYVGERSFRATYSVEFQPDGPMATCVDCETQSWHLSGSRARSDRAVRVTR